jgi:hypothetical protein
MNVTYVEDRAERDGTVSYRFTCHETNDMSFDVWITHCELFYESDEIGLGTSLNWHDILYAETNTTLSDVDDDSWHDDIVEAVRDILSN